MMHKLAVDDLLSLEEYARRRKELRAEVMAHKDRRRVHLDEYATLYFEDRLTIEYQIQEMLRIEKIFEEQEIVAELDAYNPLIPDGSNLKATFMLEYEDSAERRKALGELVGVENSVWLQVDGFEKVYAIADEDLDRTTEDKTSSVHFLRFEFLPEMIAALRQGAALAAGIDHRHYKMQLRSLPSETLSALLNDFT